MVKLSKIGLFTAILIIISLLVLNLNDSELGTKKDYANNENISKEQSKTQEYNIEIRSIRITAPIILDVDGTDKNLYLKSLENGVAHLKGSAKPGQNGNVFIFAHSSQIIGGKNQYGEIFRRLNELKDGDEINIADNNTQYTYVVKDKKIVEPSDTSVTAQDNSLKQLTLMTCWPLDTSKQRLVITALLK